MPRVYPPIESKTSSQHALPPSIVEIAAGFSAGVVSTLAVHPFDVVKTRLQINQAARTQVGGSVRIAQDIVRHEGLFTGLYRGLTPNIIGNSVSWGLYFMWYGNIKDTIQSYRGTGQKLQSIDYFAASGVSGILTAVFTNPIWVIKTRMLSTSRSAPGAYHSVIDGTRQLYRSEGLTGFYRGLIPSLFGVTHGAVQFMAYEKLKIWRMSVLTGEGLVGATKSSLGSAATPHAELSNWDFLTLSALSKIFAGSITYPYQVVRARLQMYDAKSKYRNARDVLRQVWAMEGFTGFYKGLGPNIVRVLPSTCVTFLVYENTKIFLPKFYEEEANAITASNTKS